MIDGPSVFFVLLFTVVPFLILKDRRDIRRARARAGMLERGGFGAWAERFGLEVIEAPGSWRGSLTHDGVDVVVSFDVESADGSFGDSYPTMTVTLDLRGRAPANVSARRQHMISQDNLARSMRVSPNFEGYDVEGDPVALLAFSRFDFLKPLDATFPGTSHVFRETTFEGGVLTLSIVNPNIHAAEEHVRAALDVFRGAIDALPARYDEGEALSESLRDTSLPVAPRWAAARALFERHARSDSSSALAASLDELDPLAKAACACWGAYPVFDLSAETRHAMLVPFAYDERAREDVQRALSVEVPWRTLFDATLPADVRVEAARRALRSRSAPRDPGELDGALLKVFDGPGFDAQQLGDVFHALTRGGWRPGPTTLEALAGLGVRAELLDHILERGVAPEDAPALAALAGARVPGAQDALDLLKSRVGAGRLSLAQDDAARGALSQAGARGALTAADPDEEV